MRTADEIIKTLPAKSRKRVEAMAKKLIAEEMTMQELRKAVKMTQVQMAKKLGVGQMQVSRLEKRKDIHVSTLRRAVKAMGGELQLVARFPGREPVEISELEAS
jgi:DNA-directed RNA polymerase specialized sigma subunit